MVTIIGIKPRKRIPILAISFKKTDDTAPDFTGELTRGFF